MKPIVPNAAKPRIALIAICSFFFGDIKGSNEKLYVIVASGVKQENGGPVPPVQRNQPN